MADNKDLRASELMGSAMQSPQERAWSYRMFRVFDEIYLERKRQEQLRESGKFTHTAATPGISDNTCTRVLQEEVDEALDDADTLRRAMSNVTRTMNDHAGNDADIAEKALAHLRTELVEVASVAVAWIERIDAEKKAE
jgi:hypothetical protein